MQKLEVKFEIKAPVIIAQKSGDENLTETKDYIPGTTVLGLFAGRYLRCNKVGEEFYSLFFSDRVIFGNGLIMNTQEKKACYPIPYSIQKESKGNENTLNVLHIEARQDAKMVSVNGYGVFRKNSIKQVKVGKEVHFHHVRDTERGIAKDGAIFNYQAIEPHQTFISYIYGEESDLNTLKELFPSSASKVYLGKSKTAQYGLTELTIGGITDFESVSDEPDDEDLSMTLLSDAIIYNKNGFSTTSVADIESLLGVQIESSFVKTGTQENFNVKWSLKKPSDNVFLAGSTFKLTKLPDKYLEFEKYGIGERRNEGFGRVAFNLLNESHIDVRSSYVNREKPDMPALSRKIVEQIAYKKIEDRLIIEAFKLASRIGTIPNSLLGKMRLWISAGFINFEKNLKSIDKGGNKQAKKAKESLDKAYVGYETVYDYLIGSRENVKKTLDDIISELNLAKLIATNELNAVIKNNEDVLVKLFLTKLFEQMRRANKTEGRNDVK